MTLPSGLYLPDEKIAEVCRKYKIREMSVFGSEARGESGSESDIDILVEFEPDARPGWEFFRNRRRTGRPSGAARRFGHERRPQAIRTVCGAARSAGDISGITGGLQVFIAKMNPDLLMGKCPGEVVTAPSLSRLSKS